MIVTHAQRTTPQHQHVRVECSLCCCVHTLACWPTRADRIEALLCFDMPSRASSHWLRIWGEEEGDGSGGEEGYSRRAMGNAGTLSVAGATVVGWSG